MIQFTKGTVIVRTEKTKLQMAREKIPGLTQVEVAERAGITERAYQRYEYGDRKPRVDVAKLIATALGSTVDELF